MSVAEHLVSMWRAGVASRSVRVVKEVVDMSAIYDDDVNVVILRRALPSPVSADALRAVGEPYFSRVASIPSGARGRHALEGCLSAFPSLTADIAFWAEVLGELTGCDLIGVRLARVTAAMCPRLHVDKVMLRVVSTFVGAGTEYVGSEDVDRRWLGHAAGSLSDEASGLLRSTAMIHSALPGDIVLLKGEGWPNNHGRGAVHRSPVVSSGTSRLMMTLDPL